MCIYIYIHIYICMIYMIVVCYLLSKWIGDDHNPTGKSYQPALLKSEHAEELPPHMSAAKCTRLDSWTRLLPRSMDWLQRMWIRNTGCVWICTSYASFCYIHILGPKFCIFSEFDTFVKKVYSKCWSTWVSNFLTSRIKVNLRVQAPILETDQSLEGTATEICRRAGCGERAEKSPGMHISVQRLVAVRHRGDLCGTHDAFSWTKWVTGSTAMGDKDI